MGLTGDSNGGSGLARRVREALYEYAGYGGSARIHAALDALAERNEIAERALRDIVRCDYRGNEPPEQMIARLALADMERASRGL